MDDHNTQLVALDKSAVEKLVEKAGQNLHSFEGTKFGTDLTKAGFGTPEGRDAILKHLGIDKHTPDSYRLVMFEDEVAYPKENVKMMLYKGHMDGANKLVLTEGLRVPIADPFGINETTVFLATSGSKFHQLPEQIKIHTQQSTHDAKFPGTTRLNPSAEEKEKLEKQFNLASLVDKAADVQLASNAALPSKQQAVGAGRNA